MFRQVQLNNFDRLNELASYGNKNDDFMDKICAFLLALCPILQHYKGIYQNAGFTLLIVLFPFIMIKFLLKIKYSKVDEKCLIAVFYLLLFQIFKIVDHTASITKLAYGIFFILLFISIASECININFFLKSAIFICCSAGAFLILQYILFYAFNYHLQLVPTSLLLPESDAWVLGAKTGLIGVNGSANGFYRPCAFFLEPSHLFIYCFPILCVTLLSPNMSKIKFHISVLITLGMILSTSGMGIAVSIGIWGLYYALYNNGKNKRNVACIHNIFSARNIYLLIMLIIVLVIMYFQVEFFRNAVDRIFAIGNSERSTAIDGRTERASILIGNLSGSSFIFGLTEDTSGINYNLPGFYGTLYKYGIVGLILSYLYYFRGLIKLKGQYFWISFIIIIVSFFSAHTHGTFYMTYYVIILMAGYHEIDASLFKRIKLFMGIKGFNIGGYIDRKKRYS